MWESLVLLDRIPTSGRSPAGPQSNQNVWVLPAISRDAHALDGSSSVAISRKWRTNLPSLSSTEMTGLTFSPFEFCTSFWFFFWLTLCLVTLMPFILPKCKNHCFPHLSNTHLAIHTRHISPVSVFSLCLTWGSPVGEMLSSSPPFTLYLILSTLPHSMNDCGRHCLEDRECFRCSLRLPGNRQTTTTWEHTKYFQVRACTMLKTILKTLCRSCLAIWMTSQEKHLTIFFKRNLVLEQWHVGATTERQLSSFLLCWEQLHQPRLCTLWTPWLSYLCFST